MGTDREEDRAVIDAARRAGASEPPAGSEPMSEGAFEELYRSDYRRLVALAHGLSGSRSAAEEVAQEAFLAAHRRWDEIGMYADPAAWLRRVVVNRAVSMVRRRVAEGLALARLGARRELPDALPEHDEAVWRAVRALPRRQAQVVALHYVDDRAVVEIAAILGCAEGTVKAHLHQARRSLARTLGHDLGGHDVGGVGEPASSDRPTAPAAPAHPTDPPSIADRNVEELDR